MKSGTLVLLAVTLLVIAKRSDAQIVRESAGDVSGGGGKADASRLASRVPGVSWEFRSRVRVGGDSAQRIALADFDWHGRVSSHEIDELRVASTNGHRESRQAATRLAGGSP